MNKKQNGIDYVVCKICNSKLKTLYGHLKDKHNIDCATYKKIFPTSILICAKSKKKFKGNKTHKKDCICCRCKAQRGEPRTKETKQKQSQKMKEVWQKPSHRQKVKKGWEKVAVEHPDRREKLSLARKGKSYEELYGKEKATKMRKAHSIKAKKQWKKRFEDNYEYWKSEIKRIGSIRGKKSIEIRKNSNNIIWKGVHFLSELEMKFAKIILSEPKENINCHIEIGRKTIDFYPQENDLMFQNCFVEFHPFDWSKRTTEQYYKERKKVIENSKYKGTKLVVVTNIKEGVK